MYILERKKEKREVVKKREKRSRESSPSGHAAVVQKELYGFVSEPARVGSLALF